MKCTCNAFSSSLIGVFNDYTREEGSPVKFPKIEIKESNLAVVVPTQIDPSLNSGNGSESDNLSDGGLNGTNYVWMGQAILVSILTIAGSLVTKKMDAKDEANLASISRTSPIAAAK